MTAALVQFDRLCQIVHKEAGIVLARGKEYLVESRLGPLAKERGLPSVDALVDRLIATRDRKLLEAVVDAMTTNETSFLRDKHPFETLADKVLPELVRARADRKQLRIWSAACSTGQEPYTIAMLLADRFPQLQSWDVKILATDLSPTVLAKASVGRYSQLEINRGLPAKMMVSYFDRDGAHWVAKPALKKRI
ncbi:MAG TPA: protein-glutamate O-methyltransferase CheR, partial [bacterium]|nr:protein-glutamate O-methyltransferase CheR [bacterium]